ncbi:restriction endonuclease subunit S [Bacteroides stercoris]|uniref:restriction endonuclease subunit S n=2 Tax=Bacteroides stercoris TaxID=46506 RepID=UPI0022E377B4|nr:restriction endonuclease subunit S [Bacteroides stercoris]
MVLPNSLSSYYEKFLTTGEVKCIDEEIPFEIPKGWEWTRIRNISQSYIGLTYSPTDVSSRGTIVLRSSNIQNGKIVLNDVVRVSKEISEKLQVEKNDIIICARNGSAKLVGKSAVVTDVTEPMTFGAFMAICKTALYQYVSIFLQSDLFFSQLRGVSGTTTINQLTQNNFNDFWIPIPPANEQKRIVEKLQNVSPFIERYSKSQETLNLMNIQIKEQLKKSILQEAIQGKLVPQIAEEGTAQELLEQIRQEKQKLVKEGKLKKSVLTDSVIYKGDDNKYWEKKENNVVCIDDEIPFVIPNSWNWCRLKDIGRTETGTTPSKSHPEYFGNYIPFLSPANILGSKIISETQGLSNIGIEFGRVVPKNSILQVCIGGSIGKCAIVNKPATFNQQINSITPYLCNVEFVHIVLQSEYFRLAIMDKATGTATPIINRGNWETLLFPLPPLKEQLRIIEKYKGVTSIMSR